MLFNFTNRLLILFEAIRSYGEEKRAIPVTTGYGDAGRENVLEVYL